jgi:zinc protease
MPADNSVIVFSMRFLNTAMLLAFLFAPAILGASSITDSTKEYTLKNGIKVLAIEDHKSPIVTFEMWYKAGSRYEAVGKTGLSHFLEHMMFKGTPKHGPKTFSNIIQRYGGVNNAYTTREYTVFYESLSSDRVTIPIELESDRMTNLLLDPKEVASERKVVMEERRMRYDDNPQNLLYQEVVALALIAHPYRWPVIGWMSDIVDLDREDLYRYYTQNYSPDNSFIVVAGDINTNELLPQLEKYFGGIPPSASKIEHPAVSEPLQQGDKSIHMSKESVQLPYILIAYHVPSFPNRDSYALDVLSNILAEGKSSRFYKSLVYDKKIAINVFADYSGFNKDPFLFVLGATAATGKDISDVEKLLNSEMDAIKKTAPSEREVQKARNQIEASFIFSQDSNYSKAQYAGLFEIMGGWKLMDTYIEGIRNVKPSDVQEVANKYFTAVNRTTGILFPERVKER